MYGSPALKQSVNITQEQLSFLLNDHTQWWCVCVRVHVQARVRVGGCGVRTGIFVLAPK